MKIVIGGSYSFSEEMFKVKKDLEENGHYVLVSRFIDSYKGLSEDKKQECIINDKNNNDAIKEFWELIKISDALLILNYDRKGIKNYIGGNTLMDIGFAHVLDKKIFLLNSIPDIGYKSEIEAVRPIIINGELNRIK